jgi:hypothetical protein
MAYVYEHIRKDTNEVFYVGIGSDSKYSRAFYTHGRNYLWEEVIKKTSYEVKIIEINLDWDSACRIEKELIKKYGRIDCGDGKLTNLTEGGEGFKKSHSDETKNKIRNSTKGKSYIERYGHEKTLELKELRKKHQSEIWESRSEEQKKVIYSKVSNGNKGKMTNMKDTKCPHCGKIGKIGTMNRWHFDNCVVLTNEPHKLSNEHREKLKGERLHTKNLVWMNNGEINKRINSDKKSELLKNGWKLGMI